MQSQPYRDNDPGVIYILHWHTPIHHAQHYTGSTQNLRQRLETHALYGGSALTRHLIAEGIPWRLAACGLCPKTNARFIERRLKRQNNAPRYCTVCNPRPERIPGCRMFPLSELRMPIESIGYTGQSRFNTDAQVRWTGPSEPIHTMRAILHLMRKDKDALGFIPAGGKEGLQITHDAGKIAVVSNNGQDIGYLATTTRQPRDRSLPLVVTIAQCVVADEARLMGHGAMMLDSLYSRWPGAEVLCTVRDDLPANDFWLRQGFHLQHQAPHPTSGNLLNHYSR